MNFRDMIIRRKVCLSAILWLCCFVVPARAIQNGSANQMPNHGKHLSETNRQELLRISGDLKHENMEKRRLVEEFAASNKVQIRKEFSDGKVIELVRVENGHPWYYSTNNSSAAATTKANQFWQGGRLALNLDGSTLPPIGIWDAGAVLADHQEFISNGTSRVVQQDKVTSVSTHATHVAGTLAAGGTNNKAKGMAFNARINAYDWTNDNAEMAEAAANGMLISSHSYGYTYGWNGDKWFGNAAISTREDYRFGFYSSYTREWDDIAYKAPYYLIVKSAGNDRGDKGPENAEYPADGNSDGFDCIGTDAIGKNILTVGAVSQVANYNNPSDVVLYSSSSWGPADDGRIKPDIVGKGVLVYSSSAISASAYATMNGTSMATPNVAGTLALVQEYYMQLNGSPMRASTLKALAIHTADEAGPAPGPDYMFGWGLVNGEKAAQIIRKSKENGISIQELSLTNGGSYQLQVISDGKEPLKATIAWTDPAGKALSPALNPVTPALVHDLDLSIYGTEKKYFPWKLDKNNPSAPATQNSKNHVDNVEVVFLDNPEPGTYTIQVAHTGVITGSQMYSLIISGAELYSVSQPVADFIASNNEITPGETVRFTQKAINQPTSFSWEFEGAESMASQEENPVVTYFREGTYKVKLTVTNAAGSDTEVKVNYITVKPARVEVAFNASRTTITEGESVSFSDLTANNPNSWLWTFPGGNPSTSTEKNPTITYTSPGTYNVTLLAANEQGYEELTMPGYITVVIKAPEADFTASATLTETGKEIIFTDRSTHSPISWEWTFPGGNPASSNEQNPTVTYNYSGVYDVILKVTNASGTSELIRKQYITVNASNPLTESSGAAGGITTGINDRQASGPVFKAFPNPVSDNLFVQMDSWSGPLDVRMMDIAGRVVHSSRSFDNKLTLNVSNFNKGLYILTVSDGTSVSSQRIAVH